MSVETYFDETDDKEREIDRNLADILKDAIDASLAQMNVNVPATVVDYDHKTQTITAKPDFKKKYPDGTIVDSPLIYRIPVAHPRSGSAILHLPIAAGDKVQLQFSDRSLDNWKTNGKEDHPGDTRMHHISDCYAMPGAYPLGSAMKVANADDLILMNGSMEIRLKKNGHIQILNGGDELLKILDDFMTADIAEDQYGKSAVQKRLQKLLEK